MLKIYPEICFGRHRKPGLVTGRQKFQNSKTRKEKTLILPIFGAKWGGDFALKKLNTDFNSKSKAIDTK